VPAAENPEQDVLVVGAGPAGLECAVTLGKRGFRRVHLIDGDRELGGSLRWISRLPGLSEWSRVISYRASQLQRLKNVEVILGAPLDVEDVLTYGAELVVCATGSRWSGDGINPISHAPIPGWEAAGEALFTPEEIMVAGRRPAEGSRVVIIDGDGYFMGASLAELLATEGHQVTILSMWGSVAPLCDTTLEGDLLRRRLFELGVGSHSGVTVERVEAERVVASHNWGQALEVACDAVVMVTQRRSSDELYRGLIAEPDRLEAEEIKQVFRAGDCVAPRLIADAIFDGHRLAREIETPTPAWPLPHLRERASV
jgi:dimethylamine/trimethylamine dehydrogenase